MWLRYITIAAARRIPGLVYAVDIDPLMVMATDTRASRAVFEHRCGATRLCVGRLRPTRDSISYAMLFIFCTLRNPVSLCVKRVGSCAWGNCQRYSWRHEHLKHPESPLEIRPRSTQCRRGRKRLDFSADVS